MRDWKKATRKADNVIIFSPHISCEGKCIYNILVGFAGKTSAGTYTPRISINELTQFTGLTKKKIIQATNELQDLGLITKHQTPNQKGMPSVNEYKIMDITSELYDKLTAPYIEQKQKPRGKNSKQDKTKIVSDIEEIRNKFLLLDTETSW